MSDIKMDREFSKLKMKKCKFFHQLNYLKVECKTKKETTMERNKNKSSIEGKLEINCRVGIDN